MPYLDGIQVIRQERICMNEHWIERKRPDRYEKRVFFDDYSMTRDFLDWMAEISEREGYYPDMNFGRTHVNITMYVDEESKELSDAQRRFADEVARRSPGKNYQRSSNA